MKLPVKLRNLNTLFLYASFGVTFVLISIFRYFHLNSDAGDSTLFQNIALQSSPPNYTNEFLKSIQVLIRKFVSSNNEVSILNFPSDYGLDGSLIGAHAYLSWPLFAFIMKITGFRLFISVVAALITILPLAIATYLVSKDKNKKSIQDYLPILIVLACYPSIIWASLGQYYPDRIFVAIFPIFLLVLDWMSNHSSSKLVYALLLLYGLTLATTERASLYVALACGVYVLRTQFHKILFLVLAVLSFSWSFFYYKNISTDVYTSSFFDTARSFAGLNSLIFSILTLKLLIFHLPGIILLRKMWDLRLMLLLAMIPNLLGNIGGAEKNGWVTHYMTYIAATYIGVILVFLQRKNQVIPSQERIKTKKQIKKKKREKPDKQLIAATLTAILLFTCINPHSRAEILEIDPIKHSGIFGSTYNWFTQGYSTADFAIYRKEIDRMAKVIPLQSRIGVSEETSKYVSENFKSIYMFPVNIQKLDYVVLRSASNSKEYVQLPIVNYADPDVGSQVTAQAQKLLLGRCFIDITSGAHTTIHIFKRIWKFEFDEKCLDNE